MRTSSIVLLSGGLDSLVNFKMAHDETDIKLVLFFDYGQISHRNERDASEAVAEKYGIHHKTIRLEWLQTIDTGLTKGEIPEFDAARLDDLEYALGTAKAVWVPNRNGVLLNVAAAFAERYGVSNIVTGFNREEGATFPDNTQAFLDRLNSAFEYSTANRPVALSYTIDMNKKEIVELGRKIDAPFEHLWSCYHDGRKMCGVCESCRRLVRALNAADYYEEFVKINRFGFETGTEKI